MFKFNNNVNDVVVLVFIVNFEYISHLFLVFLLLTLNKLMLAGNPLGLSINFHKSQRSKAKAILSSTIDSNRGVNFQNSIN